MSGRRLENKQTYLVVAELLGRLLRFNPYSQNTGPPLYLKKYGTFSRKVNSLTIFVFASVNSLAVPSKQMTRFRPLSIAFRRRSNWDCGVSGVLPCAEAEPAGVDPESALVFRSIGRALILRGVGRRRGEGSGRGGGYIDSPSLVIFSSCLSAPTRV